MKINSSLSRKLRYGGLSVTLTALIIVAVIILNVIFSVLTQHFMLYTDLTPPLQFTLSDAFIDLISSGDGEGAESESPIDMIEKFRAENKKYNAENGLTKDDPQWRDENVKLNIILCDEPDAWKTGNNRYVSHSAHEIEAEFPDYVSVTYIDTVTNPSAETESGDFKENLNPDSLQILSDCKLEGALANAKAGDTFQFLRNGYFCVDSRYSTPDHLVFNETVSLKGNYKPE